MRGEKWLINAPRNLFLAFWIEFTLSEKRIKLKASHIIISVSALRNFRSLQINQSRHRKKSWQLQVQIKKSLSLLWNLLASERIFCFSIKSLSSSTSMKKRDEIDKIHGHSTHKSWHRIFTTFFRALVLHISPALLQVSSPRVFYFKFHTKVQCT